MFISDVVLFLFFDCGLSVLITGQYVFGMHKKKAPTKRKTRNELLSMNQKDLFMELVEDIENELNVNMLCYKIIVNVCILVG